MMKWKNKIFELSEKITLYRVMRMALTMAVFVLFTFLPIQLFQIMRAVKVAPTQVGILDEFNADVNAEITFGEGDDELDENSKSDAQSYNGPKININTASKEMLMELPNIGAKKADEIINERSLAAFSNEADIMRVKGIGQKTYENLRAMITV